MSPFHTDGDCPPGFKKVNGECVPDREKQEQERKSGEGTHAHPHGPNGKHDHDRLPENTGGHEHTPGLLGAHKHNERDPLEGWHVNIGNGWHVHNTAQAIPQDPTREEVIDAHFPAPKWIKDSVKSQIRNPGGEWRDTTREDFEDHAKVSLHNPSMSIQDHLDLFVGPERLLEIRYFLKDGTNFRPGPKEYQMELEFLEKLIQKAVSEHSSVRVLRRPTGRSYKLDGEILYTLDEPLEGKGEGLVVFLERQRAPGTAMKNAPDDAIDASIVEQLDVGPRSAEEIAKDFLGRRVFILEKVRGGFREKDILLALLDFEKQEPEGEKTMTKSEAIRAKIPAQLRFWEAKNQAQATTIFDALLEAISDGTINLSKDNI